MSSEKLGSEKLGSDPIFVAVDAGLDARVREILSGVNDPEIPVISVLDLGIVRGIAKTPDGVEVSVTPTYAACPATEVIAHDICAALGAAGINAATVTRLHPPWTTDWITPRGRARLREYGIAPPAPAECGLPQVVRMHARAKAPPACPLCASGRTELLSQFGSTACKALYRCLECHEPFDYFKPL